MPTSLPQSVMLEKGSEIVIYKQKTEDGTHWKRASCQC